MARKKYSEDKKLIRTSISVTKAQLDFLQKQENQAEFMRELLSESKEFKQYIKERR